MTLGHELRGLDAMNSFGLYMTCTILSRDPKALDAMNSSKLRII